VNQFDPSKYPDLSPPEKKLIEALTSLEMIRDSEDDIAAREQARDAADLFNLPKEAAADKLKEIILKEMFGHTAASAYSVVSDIIDLIKPVKLTEGTALVRDQFIKSAWDKLDAYQRRRRAAAGLPPASPFPELVLPKTLVTGPTISPAK
jgi:hypothetical protein